MSAENVKEFFEQAQGDEAIQEKLKAIKADNKEEALAAVVKIAGEHGHSFEAHHYEMALQHLSAATAPEPSTADDEELSLEELDRVAGGVDVQAAIRSGLWSTFYKKHGITFGQFLTDDKTDGMGTSAYNTAVTKQGAEDIRARKALMDP